MKKYNVNDLYKVRLGLNSDSGFYNLKVKQIYFIALKKKDWLFDDVLYYLVTQHNLDLVDNNLYAGEGGIFICESTPLKLEYSIDKSRLTIDEIEQIENELNSKQSNSNSLKQLKYIEDYFENT